MAAPNGGLVEDFRDWDDRPHFTAPDRTAYRAWHATPARFCRIAQLAKPEKSFLSALHAASRVTRRLGGLFRGAIVQALRW